MGYATITKFRRLTNISKDIITDQELLEIFAIADRLVNKLISTSVHLEQLSGNINGTNKDFRTKHAPLCDTTLKNVTTVDSCDTADWTESADATADTISGKLIQGNSSIAMGKDGTASSSINYTKTFTSIDGTGTRLKLAVYIKNKDELAETSSLSIRLGTDDSNYYNVNLNRSSLKNGINEFDFKLTDLGTSGSPDISDIAYAYISFSVSSDSDTITHGNLKMDYWRLEDIDTPDTADVEVYYATEDDDTGWTEYGSAKSVASLQPTEGIITMTTAPTTSSAEAGVFANYSYVSEIMDWSLVNAAACYMAAHISSFKIAATAPNYDSIEDAFARRDLAGAPDEWLRLSFSLLMQATGDDSTGIGFRRIEADGGI